MKLAEERPVFHSEGDFQHAFAQAMRAADPELSARVEVPLVTLKHTEPAPNSRGHIDLLLIDTDNRTKTAIEFK